MHQNPISYSKVTAILLKGWFCLLVELHWEGSALAACAAGLFLRDAYKKKNAALIWVFSKPGLTPLPAPPRNFGTFGALFRSQIKKKKLLGHFLSHISPKIKEKSAQKLLDLVYPSPFSTQNSKIVGHKKMPKNFWFGSEPPPLSLWKIPKLKLHFFEEHP